MNKKDTKTLLEIFKSNRWNRISERMIEIDSYIVQKNKYLTCSCVNPTKTNEGICYHKMFFIILPFLERLEKLTKREIKYYTQARDNEKAKDKETIYGIIVDDLIKIQNLEESW